MLITIEDKLMLAQHYFNGCFNSDWYDITGINKAYELVSPNRNHIYKDDFDKKLDHFDDLKRFHCVTRKEMGDSTWVKLIVNTKNCFQQIGFNVDDSKILPNEKQTS